MSSNDEKLKERFIKNLEEDKVQRIEMNNQWRQKSKRSIKKTSKRRERKGNMDKES